MSAFSIYTLIPTKTVALTNDQVGYVSLGLSHNITQSYKRKLVPCVAGICIVEVSCCWFWGLFGWAWEWTIFVEIVNNIKKR